LALRRCLKTTTQEQLHPESIAHSRGKLTEEVEENKCLTDSSDEVPNPSAQTAAELIAELQHAGIRHNPENIVWITKLPNGKIVFLETGNTRAGLQHILEKHGVDFVNKGIPADLIPDAVLTAITNGTIVGYLGSGREPRPIYQVNFQAQNLYIAVTVSQNGFIVGANPTSMP